MPASRISLGRSGVIQMQVGQIQCVQIAPFGQQIVDHGGTVRSDVDADSLVPVKKQRRVGLSDGQLNIAGLRGTGQPCAAYGNQHSQRIGQRSGDSGFSHTRGERKIEQKRCSHQPDGRRLRYTDRRIGQLGEQGNHAGEALRQQSGGKAYGSAQPGDPRAKQRDGIEGHQQPDQWQQQDVDRYAVQGQLMKI